MNSKPRKSGYHDKMKKKGRQDKQELETKEKKVDDVNDDDEHNQGFSDWLRSVDGIEMMRLFVIANSLLVFITIAWPNMQQTYTIIKEYIMGEDDE
ncbi:uncharacterized protein Xport-A isoform X1 [Fopius arisanus]|uniref:Uncharacterized protein Xport-A isoform X1 n=2 Tax=Fopius arisanus TaxID=64838 RepID=A0A9R1TGS7_9HYME|nr:PREDICTED: uncharacterized protein LOC105270114 isoform X1 [Fopius arisanus]XP_011309131.1 PREDICTED: uncharacterized protein LOC105270114 isoform X1 [Fopius arisanus]